MFDIREVEIYECEIFDNCRRHLTAFFVRFHLTKLIFRFAARSKYAQYLSNGMRVACIALRVLWSKVSTSAGGMPDWLIHLKYLDLDYFSDEEPIFPFHVCMVPCSNSIKEVSLQKILSGLLQEDFREFSKFP